MVKVGFGVIVALALVEAEEDVVSSLGAAAAPMTGTGTPSAGARFLRRRFRLAWSRW